MTAPGPDYESEKGTGSKKRKMSGFWKDCELTRTESEAAIHETLESTLGLDCKIRFQEDAKRCLAQCIQTFMITHFHKVALLCQHRGALTPKQADFDLADILSDEAKLQRSVMELDFKEQALVSWEKQRKRLRRAQAVPELEMENVD